jgi:hypothetical protein
MHLESRNDVWLRSITFRRVVVGGVAVFFVTLFALLLPSNPGAALNGGTVHVPSPISGEVEVSTPAAAAGPQDGLEGFLGPLRTDFEDGFTIVSPTFNRSSLLPVFFDNYASGEIPSLRRVIMIWNDDTPPTQEFLDSLTKYKVPITIEQRHVNSKNERFRASENMRTAAIFALDDDMRFKPEDVEFAYQAWREYGQGRRRMLGLVAREVGPDGEYLTGPPFQAAKTYSMVLTKAAFIHIDWMHGWWADESKELRDYVESRKLPEKYPDLKTNCEDIVMSFLYAHHSRLPPIYFKAPFEDDGLVVGISAKPGHYEARTECVRHMQKVMGKDTLVSTSMVIERYTGSL